MSREEIETFLFSELETLTSECLICRTIGSGGVTPRFKDLFPGSSPEAQILTQNDAFYLIPDDSPIVPNHLLIFSKEHVLSCAGLPLEKYSQFLDLKKKAQAFLHWLNPHNSVLFFEHGAGKSETRIIQCGACLGIDHAHLHIVPIVHPPEQSQEILPFLIHHIQEILQLPPLAISPNHLQSYKDKPYLYLEENGESVLFLPPSEDASFIPSQFIRRLLGLYLSLPDNNWDLRHLHTKHRDLEKERIMETIQKFKQHGERERI